MDRRDFLAVTAAAPGLTARLGVELERTGIVSSHEHLLWENERIAEKADFFTLASHYLANDLVSAGAPATPKSWAEFGPWWPAVRLTGYGQALRIAMRELYGEEPSSAAAVARINDKLERANRPGLYERVLKEKARIRYSVLDDYWHSEPMRPDERFFVLARHLDAFCTARQAANIRKLEESTGVSITSVGGLKKAMEKSLEQSLAQGMVTLKSTLAYARSLRYEVVPEREAEADFQELMKAPQRQPPQRLSDHMFHHSLALAQERGLPYQIHTGYLAGNGGNLENTRPMLLGNLFGRYPKVSFDLFHLGWPWMNETTALAKLHRNVTADFCWMWVLSPAGARQTLDEMLEAVPANKIVGFGGDYRYVELSYAHAKMARAGIAQVLSGKVAAGWCTEGEAVEIGKMLLAENAARLFPQKKA
ncbi:MAG: amidohydrolase family protein [Acidobacteria bacterium]|nr:amidohydrolase family protein [Acidobacteriota bacterium]